MIEEEFDESMVEMGDVEAVLSLTYNIFDYIPELLFVSAYGLIMYAAILFIGKFIKEYKILTIDHHLVCISLLEQILQFGFLIFRMRLVL